MCGDQRKLRVAAYPAEAETVRLVDLPHAEQRHCGAGFPWWTLWLLWPLFWLGKGVTHALGPFFVWLWQPVALSVTPLPFLLVGAGLLILTIGALRRPRD